MVPPVAGTGVGKSTSSAMVGFAATPARSQFVAVSHSASVEPSQKSVAAREAVLRVTSAAHEADRGRASRRENRAGFEGAGIFIIEENEAGFRSRGRFPGVACADDD